MLKIRTDDPPACYGRAWSGTDPKCKGGYDSTYYQNGSHVRPSCDYFNSCGTRTQAQQVQQVVPPQNLVRPISSPPRWSPPVSYTPPTQNVPVQTTHYQHSQQQHYPPAPQWGYQQMMPVNFQIPPYLSAQETGGSFWNRMFWTSVRSVFKALGHSIAAIFDHNPIGNREQPVVIEVKQNQPPGNP